MRKRYLVIPSVLFVALPFAGLLLAKVLLWPRPDYSSLGKIPYSPVHDLGDTASRQRLWLDGRDWEFRIKGEKLWQAGMTVPACWNMIGGLENYDGKAYYRKRFFLPPSYKDKRLYLIFRGVSYRARVSINGVDIGDHEGAYTQFEFEAGSLLNPGKDNVIEMEVDNRLDDKSIPGHVKGWKHPGGIFREVYIEARPAVCFKDIIVRAEPGAAGGAGIARLSWSLSGAEDTTGYRAGFIVNEISGRRVIGPVESKDVGLTMEVPSARPWSPESPSLYTLEARLLDDSKNDETPVDVVTVIFGFKKIEVEGRSILLNGVPFKVRGISRHEDYPGFFKTQPARVMERDIRMIKSTGANTIRVGHYPCHPYLLDLCDRYGLLVWEEIPAWGGMSPDYSDDEVRVLGRSMLGEMIRRDINRVSVGFWGVGNEICTDRESGAGFIRDMAEAARALDPTRLVVAASDRYTNDGSVEFLDVAAFNIYSGWYQGTVEGLKDRIDFMLEKYPGKPVLVSEYGAGAQAGWHGASGDMYTEENQARLIMKANAIIEEKRDCAGGIIWLFSDFEDDMRIFNPQPFFNQKGLVARDRSKKIAYDVVEKIYSTPGALPAFPGWSRILPRVIAGSLAALTLVMLLGSLFSRIPVNWRLLFPDIPRYGRVWRRALVMSVIAGIYLHAVAGVFILSQPAAFPGPPMDALRIMQVVFNSPLRPLFLAACVFVLWALFSLVLETLAEWKGASGSRSMFEVSLGVGDPLAWILPYPLVSIMPFLLALSLYTFFSAPYTNIPFKALSLAFSAALVVILAKTWLSLKISFHGSVGRAFSAIFIYWITSMILGAVLFGILII